MDGYCHLIQYIQCPFHEAKVQLKVVGAGEILCEFRLPNQYGALPNGSVE